MVSTVDNSDNPLPRLNKCCFVFDLRCGVLIFVSIETLFWAVLTFASIYSEVKYIINVDIAEFSDVLDNDWYYFVLFGYPRELIDEWIRSKDDNFNYDDGNCNLISHVYIYLCSLPYRW
jgi:hypothetical protein